MNCEDTTPMPKQNFNEKLIALLKTNPDFTDESDELLPTAVKDHAWQLDHNLIRLLLSDPEVKSTSLTKLMGHWFSITTPLLTTSPPKTSLPIPIPNSVTK
ncbi:MAG: hypothetical protein OXI67_08065 [Candidatus Poribacteria bacterium]|nr:hypothetical protein [Candidatus Poribacteria bacterium]